MSAKEIITHCMLHSGLSQKEICERTGIADSTIRGYLQGRNDPTYGRLEAILKVCGYRMYVQKKK